MIVIGAVLAFTIVGVTNAVECRKINSNRLCQMAENRLVQSEAKVENMMNNLAQLDDDLNIDEALA